MRSSTPTTPAPPDSCKTGPQSGGQTKLMWELSPAIVVLDHFHAVRLANAAVDDVRRRAQQGTLGHRARATRSMASVGCCWWALSASMTGAGHASPPAGPPVTASTRSAPQGRPRSCSGACTPLATCSFRRQPFGFHQWCAEVQVPEVTRLAKTVSAWEQEVLAHHTTRPPDLVIEKVRRSAMVSATSTTTGSGSCCAAA